jgi:hypothetical protein
MKTLLTFLLLSSSLFAQNIDFPFTVSFIPKQITGFNGLHSYAFAQHNGRWLLVGGRKDGLHARQPFNAFPSNQNNTELFVVDPINGQVWSRNISELSTAIAEQLQSTNMNFYQDADTLIIIGGYGFSVTANDHKTYAALVTIQVQALMDAIVDGNTPIAPFVKQISDERLAVTGGQLGKLDDTFYLVGGHRFDGRYNPMGNPTFTQTYTNSIKKFQLKNTSTTPEIINYVTIVDEVHLHRRDYNLVSMIFDNNEKGYLLSSGVFQYNEDLPYLYPVEIKSSGHTAITGFNQYLSNYHSSKVSFYDNQTQMSHALFFGGLSQYFYNNGVLTSDPNVPFVKTVSRVSRNAAGQLEEWVLPVEMPALIGTSAEFIPNENLAFSAVDVFDMNAFTQDSIMIGHIVGGIFSSQSNPFTNNNTSATNAHATVYEVWLRKEQTNSIPVLEGKNPFDMKVFPNPTNGDIQLQFINPYQGDVELFVTNCDGKIVDERFFEKQKSGTRKFNMVKYNDLPTGTYFLNFVFDNKYVSTKTIQLIR